MLGMLTPLHVIVAVVAFALGYALLSGDCSCSESGPSST